MSLVRIPGAKRQYKDTSTGKILSRRQALKLQTGESPEQKRKRRLTEAKTDKAMREKVIKATGRGRKRGVTEVEKRRKAENLKIKQVGKVKPRLVTKANKKKMTKPMSTKKGLYVEVPFSTNIEITTGNINSARAYAAKTRRFYRYMVFLAAEKEDGGITYIYSDDLSVSSFRGMLVEWDEGDTLKLLNIENFKKGIVSKSDDQQITKILNAVIHLSYK